MKICFVSLFAYPLFYGDSKITFGGSEVQLFNLGNELAKNNEQKISFIVGNFGQDKVEFVNNIKIIRSIKIKQRSGLIGKISSFLIQMHCLFKANADVYVKRAAGPEVFVIYIFCKIFRKKFIYMTAHEIDCSGQYVKENGFFGKLYELGLMNANLVLTQSLEHRKMLKKKFGIESIIFKSGYIIPKKNSKYKSDFILWVARLEKWKQPEKFIELAKRLSDNNFVMIAPTSIDKNYSHIIKNQAIKLSNLKFMPGLSLEETNKYFSRARLFVNTSKFEGYPNTFVQAVMTGTPILSLNVNPEGFLEKNHIGYCVNNDYNKLIEKSLMLINKPDVYERFSNNCEKYAREHHDIKKISRDFLLLVNKI